MRNATLVTSWMALLASACTSSAPTTSGAADASSGGQGQGAAPDGGAGAGGSAGMGGVGGTSATSGPWTAIKLIDNASDPNTRVVHGDNTVTGIHFDDLTHGVVALHAGAVGDTGGAIEHLNSPATVDAIAYEGAGNCGAHQDCSFLQFNQTPLGLVAYITFPGADYFVFSSDKGATWAPVLASLTHTPNGSQVFIGADASGIWHAMDSVGNVWSTMTPAMPSSVTKWTKTWQTDTTTWGGQDPNANPVPTTDCQDSFHQTYYAVDAQQAFWMSPDGKTMLYPNVNRPGICRSTDGGFEFQPIDFATNQMLAKEPYAIFFTTATHGVAASSNDVLDNTGYVYVTDDAGATWKPGTLPASVNVAGSQTAIVGAFASPDGSAIWLVGFSGSSAVLPLLLKSTDGGNTFKDISAALDQAVVASNVHLSKLHAGFALDRDHIWVGGNNGGLFYSPTGAE